MNNNAKTAGASEAEHVIEKAKLRKELAEEQKSAEDTKAKCQSYSEMESNYAGDWGHIPRSA